MPSTRRSSSFLYQNYVSLPRRTRRRNRPASQRPDDSNQPMINQDEETTQYNSDYELPSVSGELWPYKSHDKAHRHRQDDGIPLTEYVPGHLRRKPLNR